MTPSALRWKRLALLLAPDLANANRNPPPGLPVGIYHLYRGQCPDVIVGWNTRDRECPACMALMALKADEEEE